MDPTDHDPLEAYSSEKTARHFAEERFRTRGAREEALVLALLARHRRPGRLLDVACGALRFLPSWKRHATAVIAGDRSAAMLHQARAACLETVTSPPGFPVDLVQLDAFRLPFPDRCAPTLVCLRLLHHFSRAEQVGAVLSELHRVSSGVVLTSFFDARTLQHLRRALRTRLGTKSSQRHAIPRSRFAALAHEAGFEIREMRPVARVFAEQCLVVLGVSGDRRA